MSRFRRSLPAHKRPICAGTGGRRTSPGPGPVAVHDQQAGGGTSAQPRTAVQVAALLGVTDRNHARRVAKRSTWVACPSDFTRPAQRTAIRSAQSPCPLERHSARARRPQPWRRPTGPAGQQHARYPTPGRIDRPADEARETARDSPLAADHMPELTHRDRRPVASAQSDSFAIPETPSVFIQFHVLPLGLQEREADSGAWRVAACVCALSQASGARVGRLGTVTGATRPPDARSWG
jgi:hypothetical protein